MNFLIVLLIFGLTNLAVAMEQPSLPDPSLFIELGNTLQAMELLQKQTGVQVEKLLACSILTSRNPEFKEANANLASSIESLRNGSDWQSLALEKIKTAFAQVAASQNVTNSTQRVAEPHLHASHKKKTKRKMWESFKEYSLKKTRTPKTPSTALAHPEEYNILNNS